ncbi:OmpA family protein [Taibaiella koreensis]|uniref:OmpA family protein n=1 Tax=Taibaiella koreensis TaxID=1268548 RepID=UPI001968B978|nr:OmpA family protein [Taibaiella koreensis]
MSNAQGIVTPKAQRLYSRAQECIRLHRSTEAETLLQKCLREAPNFTDAYTALGMLYCDNGQYSKAADVFRQASGACPSCTQAFVLPLARALCQARQYEQASSVLDQWKRSAALSPSLKGEYDRLRQNAQFGKYAVNARPTDTPINMGARINSVYDEYFPSVSIDDSTLVFTRRTNGVDEDFYIAQRDSCGGWFIARDMGSPPNSGMQEGAQMRSADGHYLFFMRCGNRSENGWEAGGCDLYFSYTKDAGWSQPVPFGATINTPGYEGMPALSCDNKELYFVSDRVGGYGGKDIWVSRFENGLWQVPENLGPEVNTPFDETAPFIASDNQTLYFVSDGHPGLGGNDIFYSRKKKDKWQRPENMGYPFNTPFDDVSLCLSADGRKAYLASNREGGLGNMDLYEVRMPETAQPEPYTYVFGIAYDSLDKRRLNYAQIEWSDAETGEKLYHYQSNRGDASYMASVLLHRKYGLHVYRVGYADYNDTISFTTAHVLAPDTLNFPLLDFNYSPPLYDTLLARFYFLRSNVQLSDSDQAQLKAMIAPYLEQTRVEFFVNGYTDDSGTPAINEELSSARARTLASLLGAMGIGDDKIHIQGWADADPIAPNDSEEHRQQNRRVEIVLRKP